MVPPSKSPSHRVARAAIFVANAAKAFGRNMCKRHAMPKALAAFATLIFFTSAVADDAARFDHFEKHIRPVLIEHCNECHGPEKQRGGLRLDSREGWTKGGDSGPAIIAGDMDASLLVKAVRYNDVALEMPPSGKLPDDVIAAFEQWVKSGAPDPRTENPNDQPTDQPKAPTIEEGREFWSFQPIRSPEIPLDESDNWSRNPIDRFIHAARLNNGLNPAVDTDRKTFIRRVTYDLTGLPPTLDEITNFVNDRSAQAYENLVDRLLQSSDFGVRWGRHWLDVVRFAESSGGGRTLLFPNAWRYRDYVINSFNEDRPYDEFLKEQIAGDLLPSDDWQDKRRKMIATAFLLLGPTNYELQDKDILEMDVIDEQLDTLGKSMLGMTIGCARCHDHKFDPIPATDYYAMAGIFKSTRAMIHSNVSTWNKVNLPVPAEEEAKLKSAEATIADCQKRLTAAEKDKENNKGKIKSLKAELSNLKAAAPKRLIAMVTQDEAKPADIHLAIRGVVSNQGPIVPRGAMRVVPCSPPSIADGQSGRKEFAQWIADPDNPLPARVMANRVWYWMMGRGLARTVDNLGFTGELPTHPLLLDHLASSLIRDDWSIKSLVRRIALSRTYRMSTQSEASSAEKDPDNRWLWRMNRKRLRAEDIRDTMLMISGNLNRTLGGPSIKSGTKIEYGYNFTTQRRSVYVPVFRNTLPEVFEVFDFADPNIQKGSRSESTIASQALWMRNNPFVIDQAESAGKEITNNAALISQSGFDFDMAIHHAYHQVLSRSPSEAELKISKEFLIDHESDRDQTQRWSLFYQTLFQSIDFRFVH